ncbi:hypothetical protein JOB18_005203 [Solea senegalensis]|uniref:Uncharacterized protein n=1 Tax=Solea senegalensis TaxID=28829 RepID=A0AAV6SE23_SOLSE|nr:hypothetical protein JOB18_005203 [Solea senegalensis]
MAGDERPCSEDNVLLTDGEKRGIMRDSKWKIVQSLEIEQTLISKAPLHAADGLVNREVYTTSPPLSGIPGA